MKNLTKIAIAGFLISVIAPLASLFVATADAATAADVATHNSQTNCWVIANNRVYNITAYLPNHPGGINAILPYCGHDITSAFSGHSQNANTILANYYVSDLIIPDTTRPVITRLGVSPVNVIVGNVYTDAGATALDNVDGNITSRIVTVNPVSTTTLGTYTVTYNVSDTAGNAALQVIRTVNVVATTTPSPTPSPTAPPSPSRQINISGRVTAISSSSLTILTEERGSWIADLATSTAIVKRGKPSLFSGIIVGTKVKIKGILDSAGNRIIAVKIIITGKKDHLEDNHSLNGEDKGKKNGWHQLGRDDDDENESEQDD
ncbi:MAG: DUF5011 domain-containing protein [Candidatus Portnoybacteria bacterium]|nr:DUF5011 domain-containing protein [Candidatus Portnoybacteria bacterium]MDD4983138.1 DUF5011 domain-containing protein [Candidatus Portnoybacteria bacterium]